MRKRIKLRDRKLPQYYRGEEIMNMVTHIVGGGLGVIVLVICIIKSALSQSVSGLISGIIFGITLVNLYTISSVYHGLIPGTAKKVLQILDHCSIYLLIAGTYTPILVCGIAPYSPYVGWGLLIVEWTLTALATTLTAIDLKKYNIFSMICYIFMGWGIVFFIPTTISAIGAYPFYLILAGGIMYTIGAVFYGVGSKIHWIHSVFHIFVVLGSLLQSLAIVLYIV